jgi:DNA-directed RNA polymerase sigma subunit (sigma70/sigma32)
MTRPAKLDIYHGASLQSIADELGISRQRVEQILHRALRKLRAEMLRRGWEADDVVVDHGCSVGEDLEMRG